MLCDHMFIKFKTKQNQTIYLYGYICDNLLKENMRLLKTKSKIVVTFRRDTGKQNRRAAPR